MRICTYFQENQEIQFKIQLNRDKTATKINEYV